MRMTADQWHGVLQESEETNDPTSDQVRSAIQRLDQDVHTIVDIEDDDGNNLIIGGGGGRYVVSGTQSDGTVMTLRRDDQEGGPQVRLVAGGQAGLFASETVVTSDDALQAATWFLSGRELPAELTWELTPPSGAPLDSA